MSVLLAERVYPFSRLNQEIKPRDEVVERKSKLGSTQKRNENSSTPVPTLRLGHFQYVRIWNSFIIKPIQGEVKSNPSQI